MTQRRVRLLLSLLLAVACSGPNQTPGTNSPPACPSPKRSGAWEAQVLNFSYSDSLKGCPFALSRADTLRVNNAILRLYFETHANSNHDMEGGYFELWRKNTSLTSGGSGLGPRLQDSGPYTSNALTYDGPFSHQNHVHGVWERPMSFVIGWPPEANKFEAESLFVKYNSRVSWPTTGPDSVYFAPTEGRFIAVATVKRDEDPGYIGGSSVVAPNVSQTWNVWGENRIGAYHYRWYINGVLQPDTSWALTRTFTSGSAVLLRADQMLIDTTYSLYLSVAAAPMYLTIAGPLEQQPYTPMQYSANPTTGTAPYTYSWSVDGSPAGSGASINSPSWGPATLHEITVHATDAIGRVGTETIYVNVNTGCDPMDPGCLDELRQTPTVPLTRKSPPPKKRPQRPLTSRIP